MDNPHLLFRQPNELSEGPLWDTRTQTLYWVDILAGNVWRSRFGASGAGEPESWSVSGRIAALGLAEDGSLLGAMDEGIARLVWGQPPRVLTTPSFDTVRVCYNDGKVGPDGAFWIGAKDRAHRDPIAGLERVFSDGRREPLEMGLTISNGLDWSPDGKHFYLADSPVRQIWRYRYDAATARISDRELFADGTESPGYPDGLAVDAEGCVWVARWAGSQLVRMAPNGEVLSRVGFPVTRVSSCAFGGPDLKTLFVTTAKEDLSPSERQAEVQAGSVFSVRVEVEGLPVHRFPAPV